MAGKKKAHGHEEEHENHERWLITYADMITLLMVLFIVLFAIGQTDLAKYKKLKQGLEGGFGKDKITIVDGGLGLADRAAKSKSLPNELALSDQEAQQQERAVEQAALAETKAGLQISLANDGLKGAVTFRTDERGLIVMVASDQVLFTAGAAELKDAGRIVLGKVAAAIRPLPNPVSIEGHTDNVPISGAYASNWELSTARATSVLRDLIENDGFPPARLSASGYADQRPIASNAGAAGRAKNRRVEIVVLATRSAVAPSRSDAASKDSSATTDTAVTTQTTTTKETTATTEPTVATQTTVTARAAGTTEVSATTEKPKS